jgi:hypothetical protein
LFFAKSDFHTGDKVFEVKGAFISGDEDDDIDEKTRDNAFRFDKEKYLSPAGEVGDFLNHSCNPNSAVVKKKNKLFIVAVKDIKGGAEIFIDYSTIIAQDDSWQMKCDCGDKNCRKIIKGFNTLPRKIRERYKFLQMVPEYIIN